MIFQKRAEIESNINFEFEIKQFQANFVSSLIFFYM